MNLLCLGWMNDAWMDGCAGRWCLMIDEYVGIEEIGLAMFRYDRNAYAITTYRSCHCSNTIHARHVYSPSLWNGSLVCAQIEEARQEISDQNS